MRKFTGDMRAEQAESTARCCRAAAALACLIVAALPAAAEPSLRLEQEIPMPGVTGRIDHMDYDPAGARLFVAAVDRGSLEVVGVAASSVLESIRGLAGPQGVAFVADAGKLYVTEGGSGECLVYDAASLRPLRRIPLGGDADNVHYDRASRRLFLSAGDTIRSLSVADDTLSPAVELPGHPEGFALTADRLYANVPVPSRQVFVVDPQRMAVVARWPLGGPLADLFSNFPLGVDERGGRLFVATRAPASLVVLDASTGARSAVAGIDADADDVFYDAVRGRVYVSCGAGFLDVIVGTGSSYSVRERVPTSPGARTALWVASRGTLFVAAPARGGSPARILVYRAR